MRFVRCPLAILVTALCAYAADGEGAARIEPDFSVAGEWGTWTITYIVGPSGMSEGANIVVEMPTGFTDFRFNDPQWLHPTKPHYFTYKASRSGVELYHHLYNLHPSTGKRHWFRRTIYLGVKKGRLQPRDTITLTIGDTAGGKNKGTTGPTFAIESKVTISSDIDGDGDGAILSELPVISTKAGEPVEMQFIVPSNAVVRKPFEVQVNVFDRFGNLVTDYDGQIMLPGGVPPTGPFRRGTILYMEPGLYRIEANVESRFGRLLSNPILVTESEPEHKIYWGDIHSHSGISHDSSGGDPYPYARDVSRLDFYSLTDHIMVNNPALRNMGKVGNDYGEGLTEPDWEWNRRRVQEYYEPGRFVTILGFEYTLIWPWGHHNVYFRGDKNDFFVGDEMPDVRSLWGAIDRETAYTIPHHLGIDWNDKGVTSAAVEWRERDDELRPSLEIYSTHGQSELYDSEHGLSYENQKGRISLSGPHYARDGWKTGARMGVVASSDNHTSQPGMRNDGLAAVLSPSLDRESIFDAIRTRHSYGTTGERIWLDFRVNGQHMGSEFKLSSGRPEITFRAAGTDKITLVEVVKLDLGTQEFERLGIMQPDSEDVEGKFWDDQFTNESMYYLRLKQEKPVRGREVWAWSSPIWVKK